MNSKIITKDPFHKGFQLDVSFRQILDAQIDTTNLLLYVYQKL